MAKEALADRIDRAAAWFESHREAIEAALPLQVGEVTFLPERPNPEGGVYGSAVDVAAVWVGLWRGGELDLCLAHAYVLGPIRKMYRAMETRSDGDQSKATRGEDEASTGQPDGLDPPKEDPTEAG